MRNLILCLFFSSCFIFQNDAIANNYSRAENAQNIEQLQEENQDLKFTIDKLEERVLANSVQVDSLGNVTEQISQEKGEVKVPTSKEEALALIALILGFIEFIFVGAIAKRLPDWLTPFVASLIIGGIVVGVGLLFSGGLFTIVDAFLVFASILGISNGVRQATKSQNATPAQA